MTNDPSKELYEGVTNKVTHSEAANLLKKLGNDMAILSTITAEQVEKVLGLGDNRYDQYKDDTVAGGLHIILTNTKDIVKDSGIVCKIIELFLIEGKISFDGINNFLENYYVFLDEMISQLNDYILNTPTEAAKKAASDALKRVEELKEKFPPIIGQVFGQHITDALNEGTLDRMALGSLARIIKNL